MVSEKQNSFWLKLRAFEFLMKNSVSTYLKYPWGLATAHSNKLQKASSNFF